ncbi:MAG: response regulator transcription factor [Candidatus Sericytochromatia bacterium]
MSRTRPEILLIDDDPVLCQVFKDIFSNEDWSIRTALSGNQGLEIAKEHKPDIAVCDIILPDINGMDVCKLLKKRQPKLQVLFLSGLSQTAEKVVGLELGAEDYITKPFGIRELRARLRAAVRRIGMSYHIPQHSRLNASQQENSDQLQLGCLTLLKTTKQIWLEDQLIQLSNRDYHLFSVLISKPDYVFSRQDLIAQMENNEVNERTIDAQIRRLRDKIESNGTVKCIETVRGVGYRFRTPNISERLIHEYSETDLGISPEGGGGPGPSQ